MHRVLTFPCRLFLLRLIVVREELSTRLGSHRLGYDNLHLRLVCLAVIINSHKVGIALFASFTVHTFGVNYGVDANVRHVSGCGHRLCLVWFLDQRLFNVGLFNGLIVGWCGPFSGGGLLVHLCA